MKFFKASPSVRLFLLVVGSVIWGGIALTGFNVVHWLLYVSGVSSLCGGDRVLPGDDDFALAHARKYRRLGALVKQRQQPPQNRWPIPRANDHGAVNCPDAGSAGSVLTYCFKAICSTPYTCVPGVSA